MKRGGGGGGRGGIDDDNDGHVLTVYLVPSAAMVRVGSGRVGFVRSCCTCMCLVGEGI